MEDLYKILPLTVETKFDQGEASVYLQFDTQNDLSTAKQILSLIQKGAKGKKNVTKNFLSKILAAICCRSAAEEQSSQDTVDFKTPDKKAAELFHSS